MTYALVLLLAAACRCPSGNAIMAGEGLVVCGDRVAGEGEAVTASNFEIFACGGSKPLLWLDAIQKARLRREGGAIRVTELASWPFGAEWEYVEVPVLEWRVTAERGSGPRLVAPAPAVSRERVRALIADYRNRKAAGADEELVARLFTAAMSGDREAAELFRAMPTDARLDGAAAETYSYAQQTFEARWGRGRRPKE